MVVVVELILVLMEVAVAIELMVEVSKNVVVKE